MTVAIGPREVTHVGTGVVTTFPVPFQFFELLVYLNGSLAPPASYSVTQSGPGLSGSVVFGTAPASGARVVILSDTAIKQETDYVNNDDFPAESHELALDRLTMAVQDSQLASGRALRTAVGTPAIAAIDLGLIADKLVLTRGDGSIATFTPGIAGAVSVKYNGQVEISDVWSAGVATVERLPIFGANTPSTTIVVPAVNTSGGGGSGISQAYVDAADVALDARLDALEAQAPVVASGAQYWGTTGVPSATNDLNDWLTPSWRSEVVETGTTINAPPGLNGDNYAVVNIRHEESDELLQLAFPDASALWDSSATVHMRGRKSSGNYSPWFSLLRADATAPGPGSPNTYTREGLA
jgi:hypothetical protein